MDQTRFVNTDPRLNDTIFQGRVLMHSNRVEDGKSVLKYGESVIPWVDRAEANLCSSIAAHGGGHMPCFDIDIPFNNMRILESASGNSHLYINKLMTWEQCCKLMNVMVEVGLLEAGWVKACKSQGCMRVRMPGYPKRGWRGYR